MASYNGLLRGVLEGCVGNFDTEMNKRPYHKYCSCALHRHKQPGGGTSDSQTHKTLVAYKLRRSWSESCLVCAHASSSSLSRTSSAINPVKPIAGVLQQEEPQPLKQVKTERSVLDV